MKSLSRPSAAPRPTGLLSSGLLSTALLSLTLLGAAPAQAAPPSDAQIDQLMQAMDYDRMKSEIVQQMSESTQGMAEAMGGGKLSPAQRQSLQRSMDKMMARTDQMLSWQNVAPIYRKVYRETFEAGEVQALTDFYATAEGRSILQKMPKALARTELALPSSGFETSRYALLRAQPLTGRFRQIRRHLKHLSHHLIGDTSHGDGRHNRSFRMLGVHRMLLHAQRLSFVHPGSGERLRVTAPVDAEFARALALFDPAPVL